MLHKYAILTCVRPGTYMCTHNLLIRYDILTKVNMGLFCVNKVSLLCEYGSILCENLLHKYLILTRSRPGMYIHVYT